jgi:hypothetical protein
LTTKIQKDDEKTKGKADFLLFLGIILSTKQKKNK